MNTRSIMTIFIIITFIVPLMNCSELKIVQILCRHGDRTPTADYREWYPTDPYINENYLPPGFGELTNEGRSRSFKLGEFIGGRYLTRLNLSTEYSSKLFKIRTSDVERCKKSAQSLLSALFTDNKSIPIDFKQLRNDHLFLGTYICPIFRTELARAQRSMRILDGKGNWTHLHEYLSAHLGVNATRYHAFILLHTLMAQSSFGLSLPNWTKKIYPSEELEENAGYEYLSQSYNTKLKRINGGLWIGEFLKNIENSVNGIEMRKMFLYVGHDVNIAGFLNALDIHQPRVPSFSSCINFETYQESGNAHHYVRLFYKNYGELEELEIPRCSSPCSLKDFKFLTKHLMSRNITKECGL